jgi:heptosyltransferase-3
MNSAPPTRILVLRGGAIGDFILTVPVLTALRRRWPHACLTLVAQPRLCRLAAACGLADATVSLDSAAVSQLQVPGSGGRPELEPMRGHDLAVCLLRDPDGVVRANLAAAGCERVLYRDPVPVTGHAADYLAGVLAPLGIAPSPPCVPELRLRDDGDGAPSPLPGRLRRPVILLHPGSGSPRKNWPAERFAELAARLAAEEAVTPVFITGEADAVAAEQLARLVPDIARLPACDLPQLAGALAAADAFVGNDAGITHIAAALGVPTAALFGPTDPAVWAPRGPRVQILSAGDFPSHLSALSVDTVLTAVRALSRAGKASS